MIDIYVFIVLICALPRLSTQPFSLPRWFLVALGLPIALACGVRLSVPILSGMAMVITLCFSAGMSKRRGIAVRYMILVAGSVCLGAAATGGVLVWMVWAAVIHSIVHLVQNVTGRIDWIDPMAAAPGGLAGNTALFGTYLLPHVFLAIHTGQFWAVPIIVAGLVTSKCRGALVGLAAGVAVIEPWTIPISLGGGLIWWLSDKRRFESMADRLNAQRYANQFITPRVLAFGVGGDVGRCLYAGKTKFTRLHHDLIQALFDGGIPLVCIYLFAGLSTVWCASVASPWLAAAMVSLMTAGMFLHTQHMSLTLLVFWVIVGQSGVSTAPSIYPTASVLAFGAVLMTWGRQLAADIYMKRWQITKKWKLLLTAYKLTPMGGPLNVLMSILSLNAKKHRSAIHHAEMAIKYFDGTAHLPAVYFTSAVSLARLGYVDEAIKRLEIACEMEPGKAEYRYALDTLRQTNKKAPTEAGAE